MEFMIAAIWMIATSFLFGFALTREKNLMTLGFGLVIMVIFTVCFNMLGLPLNYILFLAVPLAIASYIYYYQRPDLSFKMPDNTIIIVLLLAWITFGIMHDGATAYPYLEDGDPWIHATGVKWVAETGSYSTPYDETNFRRLYIEPYPPAYDAILGMAHQMTDSVSDTLKFFNAFIIALGIIFAFYCIEELTGNRRLALFATLFLTAMPCFMSHFIWAQSLSIPLLFVALYAMNKATKDQSFEFPAGLAIASIALTQPSTAVIFLFFAVLYVISKVYTDRKLIRPFATMAVIAILISAVYWGATAYRYGTDLTAQGIGFSTTKFTDPTEDTSGGIVYSILDFIHAPSNSKIDQATGIGELIFALAVIGTVLAILTLRQKNQPWLIFTLLALVFCILGTQGNALPVKLFPHRFWVFLSIPVAMLASFAYLHIESLYKHRNALLALMLLGLIFTLMLLGLIFTSAIPKFAVQTAQWPPSPSFTSQGELSGYVGLDTIIPMNTKVFTVCGIEEEDKIIGSDMLIDAWDMEQNAFRRDILSKSAVEVHSFMQAHGYEYLIISSTCVVNYGQEETSKMLNGYGASGLYEEVYSNDGFLLVKLKEAQTSS